MTVAVGVLAGACVLVLLETALFFHHLAHLRPLARCAAPPPASWPRVSVIVPARDEAHDVAATVTSRLADDYPDLELILVDDRSRDGTGELAAAAAAGDPRFTLLRVDELPAGWLGKVHALHRGAEHASGDWLLFSDGDVTVEPGTLRRAMAHALAAGLDLLALVPAFRSGSFLVDTIWTVFLRGLFVLVDPAAVRDPRRRVAMGSGGFNLVRRAALARTPGLAHLRLETGDDVALGLIVKRAGGAIELLDGSRHVSVPMYRTVRQFLRGIEKNGSTTAAYPTALLALGLALLWALVFTPLAALAVGPWWLRLLGGAALAAYTAGQLAALWTNTQRWLPALFWPVGALLMSCGLVRATWLARRNGGVRWRDTFYSLEELARGRRISF